MNIKQTTNELMIEGVLYEKTSRDVSGGAIAGEIVLEVPVTIDGEEFKSLIPVNFYAAPLTKKGTENSAFKGIKTILDTGKSLMDTNGNYEEADRVRVRSAQLSENMYYSRDGRFVSFPRIRGNFFERVKISDFAPKAQFKVKMLVNDISEEEVNIDGEKTPTGRLVVSGGLIQYNGTMDEIKFIVQNKRYIDFVEKNWQIGDTVGATGVVKLTTVVVEEEDSFESDGFGEPVLNTYTRRVSEYVITNGSNGPVDDGLDESEALAARRERKNRIAIAKEDAEKKTAKSSSGW